MYEGGCPFKDFDVNTLRSLLHTSLTEDDMKKFLNNVTTQSPEILCTRFLKLICKNDADNATISNPVQFYQRMVD